VVFDKKHVQFRTCLCIGVPPNRLLYCSFILPCIVAVPCPFLAVASVPCGSSRFLPLLLFVDHLNFISDRSSPFSPVLSFPCVSLLVFSSFICRLISIIFLPCCSALRLAFCTCTVISLSILALSLLSYLFLHCYSSYVMSPLRYAPSGSFRDRYHIQPRSEFT
jgi:hypothetical protein